MDKFISTLKQFNIDTIIDVRSVPYSKFASNYNKENIQNFLQKNNFIYVYMGDMIGGKGVKDYKSFQKNNIFLKGIERIKNALDKGFKIALMCGEKDPFECHRFNLIGDFLITQNIEVFHIVNKNNVFTQKNHKDFFVKSTHKIKQKTLF